MSAYWHYLEEAAASITFIARRDINFNDRIRCEKGDQLDSVVLEACKLAVKCSEVEEVLALELAYDSAAFARDIDRFREGHSTLVELFGASEPSYRDRLLIGLIERYPGIAFRLKVLSVCLPFEFSRTLFGLCLILLESESFERSDSEFENLVLTAISHDLGLLDVNPKFTKLDHDPRSSKDGIEDYFDHVNYSASFLERQGNIPSSVLRSIKQHHENMDGNEDYYNHVNYSSSFLERQGNIPSSVLRSIKQHHENMDGTGYPSGISGNALSEYGQHIHLYDTIYSIYTKNYLPFGKVLSDLKPVIEINAVTHFGQVAVRLLDILAQAKRSGSVFFKKEDFLKIHNETESMANYIEKSIGVIQEFTSRVGYRHEDKTLFALQNGFIHIALSYYKLRVVYKQASLADAMSVSGEYEKLSRVVEDSFLSLREIIFHINKFLYRLKLYRSHNPEGAISEQAHTAIDKISKLTVKLIH